MELMKSLNAYFSRFISRYLSTRVIFILDMIMSIVASLAMLAVIDLFLYDGKFNWKLLTAWMTCSFLFSFIFIWRFRTYRIIIRHMTLREMASFILVSLCKVLSSTLVFGLMFDFTPLLWIMAIADFFMTFGMFFILRIVMIFTYNMVKARLEGSSQLLNVLVYGIGVKSVSLLSRFQNSTHHRILGFIQFGNTDVNHVISEKKVYYVDSEEEFLKVVSRLGIQALLFATEDEAREEKDRIIRYSIDNGIKLLFAPPVDEMVDGKPVHATRNIEIEDLLMRPEIKISMKEIVENFQDKTVLVTGAAGSIGSELCRQLAGFGIKKLVLYDIINSLIHNLDNTNLLKRNLQKKLAALCEYVTPAEIICDKTASIKVEALGNAIFHKKSVILRNYESANSDHTSDRLIEPFAFSANYIDIWGYDLEKGENRVYKVSRIGNVEITSDSWINEDNHRKVEADCFRMNGETDIRVKLHLSLRAKNLLVEEYPLAEKDLKHQKEHWTLETIVHDMAGVGRFVIGLADEIDISDSPELEQYIHDYALRHIINRKRDPEAPL